MACVGGSASVDSRTTARTPVREEWVNNKKKHVIDTYLLGIGTNGT
jgi:hypothetical protein